MQVLCISLKTAHERRAFQLHQAQVLGLNLSWIDAVTTEQVSLNATPFDFNSWERPLLPTELACFMSHQQAWQRVVSLNEPALILEDDACLSSKVGELLTHIQSQTQIDHLSLEVRWRSKWLGKPVQLQTPSGLAISRLYQDRAGAAAYVLWPSGAKTLLVKAQKQGPALADAFMANEHQWRSFQAEPALAIQSDVASYHGVFVALQTTSYIQANVMFKPKSSSNWRFLIRRLMAQFRLAVRKLSCARVAEQRMPKLDLAGFEWQRQHST